MIDRTFESLGARADRLAGKVSWIGALALLVSVVVSLFLADGIGEFFRRYLVGLSFWLSVALGALFFVMIQHVTRARWSVVVRRPAESIAAAMPVLAVLAVPLLIAVLIGDSSVWRWLDAQKVAESELLQKKTAYLNGPFFVVRIVIYFAVWIYLARFFHARSVAQDAADGTEPTERARRKSGLALVVFGLTATFAAFDLLMSLDPEWFSSIFGVYFFAGSAVAGLAVLILVLQALQRAGHLGSAITTEHYHDLGKLLFAFVVFWGYIAFSQYMLIWYANIPEETVWYQHRAHGGWAVLGVTLAVGHLLVPFFGLMSRHAKRNSKVLGFWAVWLLVMHWVDMHWIVMPSFDGPAFHVLDITTFIGITGVFAGGALRVMSRAPLVAVRDPDLGDSLAFKNV